jgi:hypothetical protein
MICPCPKHIKPQVASLSTRKIIAHNEVIDNFNNSFSEAFQSALKLTSKMQNNLLMESPLCGH